MVRQTQNTQAQVGAELVLLSPFEAHSEGIACVYDKAEVGGSKSFQDSTAAVLLGSIHTTTIKDVACIHNKKPCNVGLSPDAALCQAWCRMVFSPTLCSC
jgi:hypothetical protein